MNRDFTGAPAVPPGQSLKPENRSGWIERLDIAMERLVV